MATVPTKIIDKNGKPTTVHKTILGNTKERSNTNIPPKASVVEEFSTPDDMYDEFIDFVGNNPTFPDDPNNSFVEFSDTVDRQASTLASLANDKLDFEGEGEGFQRLQSKLNSVRHAMILVNASVKNATYVSEVKTDIFLQLSALAKSHKKTNAGAYQGYNLIIGDLSILNPIIPPSPIKGVIDL